MKTIWHSKAESEMLNIADYIREAFGAKRSKIFLQEVRNTTRMLRHSPNIGFFDPLFDDCTTSYRSIIISGLSKMVYHTEGDIIYIDAFWDTRREPQQQAQQTTESFGQD